MKAEASEIAYQLNIFPNSLKISKEKSKTNFEFNDNCLNNIHTSKVNLKIV
jgi:hypothetical protein